MKMFFWNTKIYQRLKMYETQYLKQCRLKCIKIKFYFVAKIGFSTGWKSLAEEAFKI